MQIFWYWQHIYWIYFCSRYYILRTVFRWPEAIRNIWVKGWSHLVFGEKIQQRTSKISRYWDAQLFNLYEMLHRNLVCPCNLLLSRSEITTFWTNIATKYFYDFMLQFFLSVHTCNKACVSSVFLFSFFRKDVRCCHEAVSDNITVSFT